MINAKENRRDNQEWTIQRNCQHWIYKTQDKDNPEKLATVDTQDTGQTVVNKPQRKPKGKSRMDNPEKLATLDT